MLHFIKAGVNYMMGEGSDYFFPGGRIVKIINITRTATNSSNPLVIAKNLTLTVADCCLPPPLRLAAHCVAASSLVTASILYPNPATIGSSVHVVAELFELCP